MRTSPECSWALMGTWEQLRVCCHGRSWVLMSVHECSWWHAAMLMSAFDCLWLPMNPQECSWACISAHKWFWHHGAMLIYAHACSWILVYDWSEQWYVCEESWSMIGQSSGMIGKSSCVVGKSSGVVTHILLILLYSSFLCSHVATVANQIRPAIVWPRSKVWMNANSFQTT